MKLTCSYSGVEFSVTHFGGLKANSVHPIFELPTKSLLSRTVDFYRQETTSAEKRLLFLALLNSSSLLVWRSHAEPSEKIIVSYFEQLAKTIGWMDIYEVAAGRRTGPAFPCFVINNETKSLSNIFHWLTAWKNARIEYEGGSKRESLTQRINRRERALDKLINDSNKSTQSYAWMLAHWAADATEFPENIQVRLTTSDVPITLREYWISLLCEKNNFALVGKDLEELEEHLIDNLEHGSVYAHAVLSLVREKRGFSENKLGLTLDATASFTILDSVEQENRATIASIAPSREPARGEYANDVEFLTAKARWIIKQSMQKMEKKL